MSKRYPLISMEDLCSLLGKSRQAWYKARSKKDDRELQEMLVLEEVRRIRKDLPRIGTYKLHFMLGDFLKKSQIKMARQSLNSLLKSNHVLVKRKKSRRIRTTHSFKHWRNYYPNLAKDMIIDRAHRLWTADITYILVGEHYNFLSLITDAYSHVIVGWALSETLAAKGPLQALQMALVQRKYRSSELIHHSDRGIQYYAVAYRKLLDVHGIKISMTQNSDPYENAIAERINGSIKDEMLGKKVFADFPKAYKAIEHAIYNYNHLRPHRSCDLLTPMQAHTQRGPLKKHWKKRAFKVPDSLTPTLLELQKESETNARDSLNN